MLEDLMSDFIVHWFTVKKGDREVEGFFLLVPELPESCIGPRTVCVNSK